MNTTFDIGKAKVAVLLGGHSAEREISLKSGSGVLQALRSRGVNAHAFDPAQQPLHLLKEQGFTHAFIALHGRYGEDGCVQGALELLAIPYTGSGVMASAIAMDKVMTKRVWSALGLSTPQSVWLPPQAQTPQAIASIPEKLGLPLMVKPPREGSSLGMTRVTHADQMAQAVVLATEFDSDLLCEEFIQGYELTCPVIGSGETAQALPVIRIEAPNGEYDFKNKYTGNAVKYHCPCDLPGEKETEIQELVVQAYRALGCRGWARADIMLRASDQKPFLLEINTSPGMTDHSLVPMSARAAGISYEDLCLRLLASASLDHSYKGA
jgi:D-alanine-D-alanine ligase